MSGLTLAEAVAMVHQTYKLGGVDEETAVDILAETTGMSRALCSALLLDERSGNTLPPRDETGGWQR